MLLDDAGRRKELFEGFRRTTNNRMELRAVIVALESLTKPCNVRLITDSQYVVNTIEKKWLVAWQKRGWRKSDKSPVMNVDLWKRLLPQLEVHQIKFEWTRGHSGNTENERCDELAVAAIRGSHLLEDTPIP